MERFHPRAEPGGPGAGFDVVVASTGQVVRGEADQSIMDALVGVGVDVESSCREGTCASCETPVVGGDVEHRDSVLSEAEREAGKMMMVCVSRARSPCLALDL